MTEPDWNRLRLEIQRLMAEAVWPFVTPLAVSHEGGGGQAIGTGSYFQIRDTYYILTADHTVSDAAGRVLGHLPLRREQYFALRHFERRAWPVDVALAEVEAWPEKTDRSALDPGVFDSRYDPVEHELLFWLGFPGSTNIRHDPSMPTRIRRDIFGEVQNDAYPVLTRASNYPEFVSSYFDPAHHFLLEYPDKAVAEGDMDRDLAHPMGMSGSLVWDTKAVWALRNGVNWNPNMARVCGVAFRAAEKPAVVIATKVEHIGTFLLQCARKRAAYFHWVSRGHPLWNEMDDWCWAEKQIPNLAFVPDDDGRHSTSRDPRVSIAPQSR